MSTIHSQREVPESFIRKIDPVNLVLSEAMVLSGKDRHGYEHRIEIPAGKHQVDFQLRTELISTDPETSGTRVYVEFKFRQSGANPSVTIGRLLEMREILPSIMASITELQSAEMVNEDKKVERRGHHAVSLKSSPEEIMLRVNRTDYYIPADSMAAVIVDRIESDQGVSHLLVQCRVALRRSGEESVKRGLLGYKIPITYLFSAGKIEPVSIGY